MRVRLYNENRSKLNKGPMRTTFKKSNKVKLSGIPGNSGGDVVGDFRLLEDDFIRLTEDGDLRILE